jgi:hypothetical protein
LILFYGESISYWKKPRPNRAGYASAERAGGKIKRENLVIGSLTRKAKGEKGKERRAGSISVVDSVPLERFNKIVACVAVDFQKNRTLQFQTENPHDRLGVNHISA